MCSEAAGPKMDLACFLFRRTAKILFLELIQVHMQIQEVAMSTITPVAASGDATGRSSRPVPTEAERAAATTMLRMIWGIHISRSVHAVAKLGSADVLAAGPVSSEELARATGTHQPSLYR